MMETGDFTLPDVVLQKPIVLVGEEHKRVRYGRKKVEHARNVLFGL